MKENVECLELRAEVVEPFLKSVSMVSSNLDKFGCSVLVFHIFRFFERSDT